MRDNVPLSWIEDAEAKQVLTAALFEQVQASSWCKTGRKALAEWLPQVGAWLAPVPRGGWPLQMQTALIRRAACRHARRRANDNTYICEW